MRPASASIDAPRWVGSILDNRVTALLARLALTLPYWWSGIDKATHPHAALAEVAGLLDTTQPLPMYVLLLIVQLGGSLLVIFNRWAWLGAGALGVFTLIVTILVHAFWNLDGPARFAEMNTFMEHIALVAGFVFVAMTACHSPKNPIKNPIR
jgi:transmembrane protein